MRKLLPLMVLLLSSCVSVKNLPQNPQPYISTLKFVRAIRQEKGQVLPVEFRRGVGEKPVIYLVLKNAEGKNRVEFRIYRGKTLLEKHSLEFGKPGEYYGKVTIWQGLNIEKKGGYILAVFINGKLLAVKTFRIE